MGDSIQSETAAGSDGTSTVQETKLSLPPGDVISSPPIASSSTPVSPFSPPISYSNGREKPNRSVVITTVQAPLPFHNNFARTFKASSGRYDHYLKLSYMLTACFVCCCALPSLALTIPAIYFSKMAKRAETEQKAELVIRNERLSLVFNILGLVVYITLVVGAIVIVFVMEGKKIMAYSSKMK